MQPDAVNRHAAEAGQIIESKPAESMTSEQARHFRALAEPFTFAALQWPALLGSLALEGSAWTLAARIALGLWALLIQVAAWRRGAGYGNAMLLLAASVTGAWFTHPSAWTWAWVPLILLSLLVAQQLRLQACR